MAQITLNSSGVASNGSLVLQSNGTTTAVTINSSQGVEFNAGTAALPAITTTGDTNTGIFFPAADTIAFTKGGAEAMRIDSSGNLIVNGTTTLNGNAKISVVNPINSSFGIATGFGTAAGQFRLIYYFSGTGALNFDNGSNNATLSTAGAWTNASDGRQKTNVTDIKYGLNTVLAVEPHSYNRIDCDGDFIGFVAQELKEHIPEVVFGSEDKSYSVDYGSLVAVAFKAIQEQQALITALTARITALEAN